MTSYADDAIGIIHSGNHVVIAENRVLGANAKATSSGIVSQPAYLSDNAAAVIRDNVVMGYSLGILMTGGAVYSGNNVFGAFFPYSGGTGHGTTNTP